MSAIKFQVGEANRLTLAFDSPKTGTNSYWALYMYGVKSDINSDEDCFFATETLHTMIRTLGAGEGDEIKIEKCQDGDASYFKVNGLTIKDMISGGAFEKIAEAKPTQPKESLDVGVEDRIRKIENRLDALEANQPKQLTAADIPF